MSGGPQTRPSLDDVTLVAVTSVAPLATIEALEASMREADFAEALFLSDQPPARANPRLTWRRIDRLASRADYSRFMLRDLAEHIATTHALCVQWDGFVLNGQSWDPRFLDYDYIGAVWPQFTDGGNVGNGGFSLRSQRLLRAGRDLPSNGAVSEDVTIGRIYRPWLEERGMRFAPEEVARKFAYERTEPCGREFGFHGVFNLVALLPPPDAIQLLRSLEPQVLARSEHHELLRWALRHGRFRLALTILSRLRTRQALSAAHHGST